MKLVEYNNSDLDDVSKLCINLGGRVVSGFVGTFVGTFVGGPIGTATGVSMGGKLAVKGVEHMLNYSKYKCPRCGKTCRIHNDH